MQLLKLALLTSAALLAAPANAQGPAPGPTPQPAPSVVGLWRAPFDHDVSTFAHPPTDASNPNPGFNAIHMALIPKGPHRGKVFVMDREAANDSPSPPIPGSWIQRYGIIDVFDASSPNFFNYTLEFNEGQGDLFCAGHSWSHEGKLLLAGGTTEYGTIGGTDWSGGKMFLGFNPDQPTPSGWEYYPDLEEGRWYPTINMLGDLDPFGYQRYLILGGLSANTMTQSSVVLNNYEAVHINGAQVRLDPNVYKGPQYSSLGLPPKHRLGLYPRTVLMSDGQLFRAGISDRGALKTHVTGQDTINTGGPSGWDESFPNSARVRRGGSAVLVPNLEVSGTRIENRVLLIGGKREAQVLPTDEIEYVDVLSNPSGWSTFDSMEFARWRQNSILLPDSSVLVVGGNRNDSPTFNGIPVFEPEWLRFDSQGVGTWTTLPEMDRPRTYHASTVLLPNGKVLVGGGDTRDIQVDPITGQTTNPPVYYSGPSDYQVYEPWYIHAGLEKPVLSALTEDVDYGDALTVSYLDMLTTNVAKVVLIRPGSTTHHNDYDQRYLELDHAAPPGQTQVTVNLPTNRNQLLPGYWMLFLVSEQGIPSDAGWIHVQN